MKKQSISQQRTNAAASSIKSGRSLKEIIPASFQNHRIMTPLFNYDNFKIKKERDYSPPYDPFDIFPEWPSEDEVQVLIH